MGREHELAQVLIILIDIHMSDSYRRILSRYLARLRVEGLIAQISPTESLQEFLRVLNLLRALFRLVDCNTDSLRRRLLWWHFFNRRRASHLFSVSTVG